MQIIKSLIEYIFPYYCLICGKILKSNWVCEDCLSLIDILDRQFCPHCSQVTVDGKKCKPSVKSYINNIFSATDYKNQVVKKIIHSFKYPPFCKGLANELSAIIYYHIVNLDKVKLFYNNENFGITYIPLHQKKLKWRGFNQSELVARKLSEMLKIDFFENVLIKTKNTNSQTSLKKEERAQNIKDCFAINKKPSKKEIIIVDDIYTTGATMQEAAKILKENGVNKVIAMVVARE